MNWRQVLSFEPEEEDQELYYNTIERVKMLGQKYHISDDVIRKYILGLEEGFEPGIYATMGDAELLIDIHLFIKNLGEVH